MSGVGLPRIWTVAALLGLALASCRADVPAVATTLPSLSEIPTAAQPAWAGEYRWAMRERDGAGTPSRLRLGFTALPSGDWTVTGSVVLDDAELGASGSARLRDGQLVVDVLLSGGVRDVPPDEGKRALFAPGQVPARIASAGFATMRIALDPRTLQGVAQRYQVNVVQGNHVQGPMYAESTLLPEPADAAP